MRSPGSASGEGIPAGEPTMPLSVGSPTILTVLTAIAWDFKLVPAAAPSAPARANEREIGHLARVKRLLARPASGTVVTAGTKGARPCSAGAPRRSRW